jgi:hypothetical protein
MAFGGSVLTRSSRSVLFGITLFYTSVYLHRHRGAGGHSTLARNNDAGNTTGYTGTNPEDFRPEGV